MHRPDEVGIEGGVLECEQIKSGSGNGAWFGTVILVELCSAFQGEDIRVFYPLAVRSIVPLVLDHVPERAILGFGVKDLFDFPFGQIAGGFQEDGCWFIIAGAAFKGVVFGKLELHDWKDRVELGEPGR